MSRRPDVVIFLADDLGFSDVGCYGSEISTPNIDQLASEGTRFTNFFNTARCSPSRASLLTGRHPHETGIGVLTKDRRPYGYPGDLDPSIATLPEVLKEHGYATGMVGKWHLSTALRTPSPSWPTRRGFDYFYGTISGTSSYYRPATLMRGEAPAEDEAKDVADYYYTTALAAEATRFVNEVPQDQPLFLYFAFTAPHWPLHAPAELVERYAGKYSEGWDALRSERFERQKALGVIPDAASPAPRDPSVPAWVDISEKDWQQRRMEVYAAQITAMDAAIGRVLDALVERGTRNNSLLMFLSDNGASAEELPVGDPEAFKSRTELFNRLDRDGNEVQLGNSPDIVPGPESTYSSYGRAWANASNTPYRRFKKWTHLGGIATPLVVSWPKDHVETTAASSSPADIDSTPGQLTAIAPTVLDVIGVSGEPMTRRSQPLPRPGAKADAVGEVPLFWEHCGNAAVRIGRWKLTRVFKGPWELHDLMEDPFETHDVSQDRPQLVSDLSSEWAAWAEMVGVIPFEQVVAGVVAEGLDASVAER